MWLNPTRLSAYGYWQFWRDTEDGDVGRSLRLFTDLPLTEITRLEGLKGAEINDREKRLSPTKRRAYATAMLRPALQRAPPLQLFKARRSPLRQARVPSFNADLSNLPTTTLDDAGRMLVIDAVVNLGMAASKSDARRLIEQGGVKINRSARDVGDRRAVRHRSRCSGQRTHQRGQEAARSGQARLTALAHARCERRCSSSRAPRNGAPQS